MVKISSRPAIRRAFARQLRRHLFDLASSRQGVAFAEIAKEGAASSMARIISSA